MIIPLRSPLVIAHRGASGYRPEHTRAAFELAIALGADAVEPDLVASSDGVLVIRHENEISGTTDVARRPEFAARRTTRVVDGVTLTGWFTEDFTWAELSTLRAMERLPGIRPDNSAFDGEEGLLRLEDLLAILDAADHAVGLVAEVKHATHFAAAGLPLDGLLADALDSAGWAADPRVTVESFELTVLGRLRAAGFARLVYLVDDEGAPADTPASPFAESLTDAGLASLAAAVDGISVPKSLILEPDIHDTLALVARAKAAGLLVFCWTLRPENAFLVGGNRRGAVASAVGDWRSEFAAVIASGVDGVFADHPDLAIAVRDASPAV